MNWGNKIALAYGSFVALMAFMVYMCFQQKDLFLVTENYYEKELKYEQVIIKKQNVKKLSSELIIDYTENGISITFPKECMGAQGTLTFYRPSSSYLDVEIPVNISTQKLVFPTSSMKGNYLMKVDWEKDSKGYYLEQKVIL